MSAAAVGVSLGDQLAAPDASCRAAVIIPAKDEAESLAETLDALRKQVDLDGNAVPHRSYEVLLLLNNCTDASLDVAHRYAEAYASLNLHVLACELEPEHAHVGTARRALMDLACDRLESVTQGELILSTDADTRVAPDWIARNLAEMAAGAEVVGGVIHLFADDLARLDPGTRLAYERDRELQHQVAKLESLLDPDPADPWPRHLEHFGASLACTPAIYRRSGGLPAVKPLEDVAFIDALRKVGARIRHAPNVKLWTSARMDGRAEVGLSGQLRLWQEEARRGLPQMVQSAAWMAHRFSTLGRLRRLHQDTGALEAFPESWHERLHKHLQEQLPQPRFLEALDCDRLIEETFGDTPRHAEITQTLADLRRRIASLS